MSYNTKYKKVGILITHGTDTMAWTFHFLRYALKNIPCNIVLTGSQIPLEWLFGGSDAPKNIENSIRLLTYVRGPGVFMVFNNGQVGFDDNIRKVHMWHEEAFDGNLSFEFMLDYIKHISGTYELIKPRRLDVLLHISTGGTIESEKADLGYLKPREKPDVVRSYLNKFAGSFFIDLIPRSIKEAKDSSNITPEDWQEICEIVERELRSLNYTTYADLKFNYNVTILSPSPMMKTKDYIELMKPYDGIIISGYGGGNVNILENSEYSLLKAIDWAINQGKVVVLGSQVNRGISEPLYETGWKAIEHGALPSGDFGIPKSQVKLSYILGHREQIEKLAKENNIEIEKLVALAFLSGVKFRSLHIRRKVENLIGFKIPEADPFFNTDFETAIKELIKSLKSEKLITRHFDNVDEFVNWIDSEKEQLVNTALILKPDSVVGFNRWGEGIDGSRNLEYIINTAFEWNIATIDFTKINYLKLKEAIYQKFGVSLGQFLRRFKYVFLESGRFSINDEKSFTQQFTRENYLELIRELLLSRTLNNAPFIYLGVGHHGFAITLNNIILELVDNKEQYREELTRIDKQVANEFINMLTEIDEVGSKIRIIDTSGKIIAQGYRDRFFVVSEAQGERGITNLISYSLKKSTPKNLLTEYMITAKLGSGILEDLVSIDKIDVAVLHDDQVNEEAVLFLNYALRKLRAFTKKHEKAVKKAESLKKILFGLPIGLEILCSIHSQVSKKPLFNVAGLAIYYYDYNEAMLLRDFSYQFHPEILSDMRSFENVYNKALSIKDDGLKLLVTTIYSSFAKNWIQT